MAVRTIIRGDSYQLRRPFYTYTFVDENDAPLDLTGCTIRTTYKTEKTDPTVDTTDTDAAIKHTIVIDTFGVATTQTGLYLVGAATGGILKERLSATESRALPLETALYSDLELTDFNGEVFTWVFDDTLVAIDGYTNRTSG
jgi:hypothetical protein